MRGGKKDDMMHMCGFYFYFVCRNCGIMISADLDKNHVEIGQDHFCKRFLPTKNDALMTETNEMTKKISLMKNVAIE